MQELLQLRLQQILAQYLIPFFNLLGNVVFLIQQGPLFQALTTHPPPPPTPRTRARTASPKPNSTQKNKNPIKALLTQGCIQTKFRKIKERERETLKDRSWREQRLESEIKDVKIKIRTKFSYKVGCSLMLQFYSISFYWRF